MNTSAAAVLVEEDRPGEPAPDDGSHALAPTGHGSTSRALLLPLGVTWIEEEQAWPARLRNKLPKDAVGVLFEGYSAH